MRKAFMILFLIVIALPVFAVGKVTIDPNTSVVDKDSDEPLSDIRLNQLITYSVSRKAVSAILDDLTKSTGVTFKAGFNSKDWQVRDRKMSIFAKDATLSEIMNSIARVMKFKWNKSGDEDRWTYRLFMDRKTLLNAGAMRSRQEQQKEEKQTKRREQAIEDYSKLNQLSGSDIEKLKTENPFMYMAAQSGLPGSLGAFFAHTPEAMNAIASGQCLDMNGLQLSSSAQSELMQSMRQMNDMLSKISNGKYSSALPNDLGADASKINISINKMRQNVPGMHSSFMMGDVIISYNDKSSLVPMLDPNSDIAKLMGKAILESNEQNRNIDDVLKENIAELTNAMMQAVKEESAGGEPLIEHADDPALDAKIVLKPESVKLPDIEKALAEESKFAVVSDYFPDEMQIPANVPKTETAIKETLDKIGEALTYNWDKRGSVIELRDRNWFKKRAAQIPEAQLEAWRQELIKTGTLDIDSLAQIAQLDIEQTSMNVFPDEILRTCMGSYFSSKDILRLYATLTQNQRAALFTDTGLDLAALSQDQSELAVKLIRANHFKDLDEEAPISIICERTQHEKTFYYAFSVIVDGNQGKTEWIIGTPIYTPPATKGENVPKPANDAKSK